MKIAIITCHTMRYTPYISVYTKLFEDNNAEYIIINEHEEKDFVPESNHYVYSLPVQKTLVGKIKKFFGWDKYVRDILKKENVDRIVFLTTWPAVKQFWLCLFGYRNKFIIDIRDYSSEGTKWYSTIVNMCIKKSAITTVSSAKFKTWLTESDKISVLHNLPPIPEEKDNVTLSKGKEKTTIGYIGLLNYEKQNRAIVDSCSAHDDIYMLYKGTVERNCHLPEYCEEMKYTNVAFSGRYDNSQKAKLYDDVDMINAVYGNDSLIVTTALPNKLYDGALYKKPLIASEGTYLGELVKQYNLGMCIDTENDDIYAKVKDYVDNFDEELFRKGCREFLDFVLNEQKNTLDKIKNFATRK